MTGTKQNKTVRADAVELNDAALDQAAGGTEQLHYTITVKDTRIVPGDGSVRFIKDSINP